CPVISRIYVGPLKGISLSDRAAKPPKRCRCWIGNCCSAPPAPLQGKSARTIELVSQSFNHLYGKYAQRACFNARNYVIARNVRRRPTTRRPAPAEYRHEHSRD